jgi:hypothetical protein
VWNLNCNVTCLDCAGVAVIGDVMVWGLFRVCSFLRLVAFYLILIGLANSFVRSKAKT